MDAALHGHAEVIKLLLEAGAVAIKTKEVVNNTMLRWLRRTLPPRPLLLTRPPLQFNAASLRPRENERLLL